MQLNGYSLRIPKLPAHSRSALGLIILTALGYAGNFFRWSLFFDIDFLFGSIAVWLVVCLYGTGWGTLVGFLAGSCTYLIWHHPYSTITFTCETLLVSLLFHRYRQSLVLLDGLFWLVVGMPLVWLFYVQILHVDLTQAQTILLKQPVNGLFNALIASLIITYLPVHRWLNRPQPISHLSLQQTIFHLLTAFVFFPTLILMILSSQRVVTDIRLSAQEVLSATSTHLVVEVKNWQQQYVRAANELAKLVPPDRSGNLESLQQAVQLTQKLFPDFYSLSITDLAGVSWFDRQQTSTTGNRNKILQPVKQSLKPNFSNVLVKQDGSAPRILLSLPIVQSQHLIGFVTGEIQLTGIETLLRANKTRQEPDMTLVDQQRVIIASTQLDRQPGKVFERSQNSMTYRIDSETYQWFPTDISRLVMVQWSHSLFVREVRISPEIPWTLILEAPATPKVQLIEKIHIRNLLILLLITLLGLIFSVLLSRRLVEPLEHLAKTTTNLPDKLLERAVIYWPSSEISELAKLVQNFKAMARSLIQEFQEIQQAKETLEHKVLERTQALMQVNQTLATEVSERQQAEAALRESEYLLRQQTERERLFHAIAQRIRQSLDLDMILHTTVAEVRQYLQTDRVIIYQFDADWGGIVVTESVANGWQSILGRRIQDSYFQEEQGRRLQQKRVQAIADVDKAHLSPCHVEFLKDFQVRANLVVPILKVNSDLTSLQSSDLKLSPLSAESSDIDPLEEEPSRLWGLLVAQNCSAPRQWQILEIDFLKQLATQAAIAIHQSELYLRLQSLNSALEGQVEERTKQLQQALTYEAMLKRITDKVRDSLDENQILQTVVEELTQGLEAYSCDTALINLEESTLTISHQYSLGASLPLQEGPRILQFSQVNSQLQAGKWLQFCNLVSRSIESTPDAHSVLVCPIVDDQGILGVLRLFQSKEKVSSEAEIRLVQQVANQCAIAIRQARLYQAAQLQVKVLEELNQLKDDFLSTVSHELRTPISNMKMAIHMLKLVPDEAHHERYLEILQSECAREADLINDLLDLQRLAAGTKTLEIESIHLSDWLTPILAPFEERVQNRQQELLIEIAHDLPPLLSDSGSLERVLAELLNNACKYTPPGETITVRLTCEDKNSRDERQESAVQTKFLHLSVINSGVEIPATELTKIFDKFYRVPGIDRWKQGGTGLGLALVQKLITYLGGRIWVESASNKTCFTIELPFAPSMI